MLDKEKKGEIIEIKNNIDEIMAYTLEVEKGDDIYVFFEYDEEGNELAAHIHEFRRDKDIYVLAGFCYTNDYCWWHKRYKKFDNTRINSCRYILSTQWHCIWRKPYFPFDCC